MAAVTEVPMVNVVINGIELQVPKGELVVEAVKRLGLEIPIFCYHPRMKPVGMCRMCLVETGMKQPDGTIRMMPKPAAGCTLPCSEGLVINTDSEMVHRDRKGVLEFLLINHPLDCPICDRGGECPLQNNTLFYGPSTSRYVEIKRHAPKAFPLSDYVTLDLERCIQCARCVRFTEEISGDSQLAFRFRGAQTQPVTFQLTKFTSKFSGNVIEICPVGALTNRKYRFRARPWDLETRPSLCTLCSNNCNVWFDYRAGKLVRVNGRTNEAINEEWTCDKGKFGHDFYNSDKRLGDVLVRQGNALVKTEWSAAYAEIGGAFAGKKSEAAFLVGTSISNEGQYLLKKFATDVVGTDLVDYRFEAHSAKPAALTQVENLISDFEHAKSVFVFGTSLADEEPILFLRVRKGWFNKGTKVVVAHPTETDVDSFAHSILRTEKLAEIAKGLLAETVRRGGVSLPDQVQVFIANSSLKTFAEAAEISETEATDVYELLAGAPIITTSGLANHADGALIAETLSAFAKATGGTFNCYARGGNEQGSRQLGVAGATQSAHEILKAAAEGKVKALWIAGVDPFAHADHATVVAALENVDFLVVQDVQQTEAFHYASVVLPMTAPGEQDGSYTNLEGRVQLLKQVLPAVGSAKPAWKAVTELSVRLKPGAPYFHAVDVAKEIAANVPAFAGATHDNLGGEGFLSNRPTPVAAG